MAVILSVLGIVIAAVGLAAVGFGIPINEFTLGTTLLVTGTTALTGGLILIGLAAVVGELGRVADALKMRAVARPGARPPETPEPMAPAVPGSRPAAAIAPVSQRPRPEEAPSPRPHPAAAPSAAVDVSAGAIERLRSTIPRTERPKAEPSMVAADEEVPLSPSETVPQPPPPPRPAGGEPSPLGPKVTAEDRAGGAAVEALKASRLDFLFRSKPVRPAPPPESFGSVRPTESRAPEARAPASAGPEPQADPEQAQGQPAPVSLEPQSQQADPPPVEEPRAVAILKSGVVDGMAYTLYADGSIEAKLPHGTVRFGSIAELRAHIESNS
jgi:hypothetical protein